MLGLCLTTAIAGYVLQAPLVPTAAARSSRIVLEDFPTPKQILNTDNARESAALSQKFNAAAWKTLGEDKSKTVAIIGGGERAAEWHTPPPPFPARRSVRLLSGQ